jgi:hypothetical protein
MLYGTRRKNCKIRSQLGMSKLYRQIHERKKNCHQKEFQSNFYIKNRKEDVIQEHQEEVGSMLEGGTG